MENLDYRDNIRIINHELTGPDGAEIKTTDDVFPFVLPQDFKKLNAVEVQVKFSALLAEAAASGFNVTVSNESEPLLGMGGYRPCVEIRPTYELVRIKMDEVQARKDHFKKYGCHGFTVAETEETQPIKGKPKFEIFEPTDEERRRGYFAP